MRRVIPTCLLAVGLAVVGASAQDTSVRSTTQVETDDAKTVKLTGCLTGVPSSFTLSRVTPSPNSRRPTDLSAVGTSGTLTSYALTPRGSVDLRPHIGQKVEVTGIVLAATDDADDDVEISVREKTEVETDDAPDQEVETRTESEVSGGGARKFAVTSVKLISPTCE